MPRGQRYELEGLLLRNRQGQPVLEVADGGTWRLALSVRVEPLLGTRVSVIGIRSGFDLLDVEEIGTAGPSRVDHATWWRRLLALAR